MDNSFSILSNTIKNRRSTKPAKMNGRRIPDQHIADLLELADWAPTHGFTEPWRFVVYADPTDFCHQHAELFRENTDDKNFQDGVYNNLYNQGNLVSHVIVSLMKRGHLPKIPVLEEIEAVSCAVQNILLSATALGLASFWSTGGMAQKQPMKDLFGLGDDDHFIGILYIGYADEHPAGQRTIPLEDKIKWVKKLA